eukprot:758257-Amphidinium_carterae.1
MTSVGTSSVKGLLNLAHHTQPASRYAQKRRDVSEAGNSYFKIGVCSGWCWKASYGKPCITDAEVFPDGSQIQNDGVRQRYIVFCLGNPSDCRRLP